MRNPLSQAQLYAKLQSLVPAFDTYRKTQGGNLTADQVNLMADLYDDVQVLTSGALPRKFLRSCPSCVREVFAVFISLYDRLDRNPEINPDALSNVKDILNAPAPENVTIAPTVASETSTSEPLPSDHAPIDVSEKTDVEIEAEQGLKLAPVIEDNTPPVVIPAETGNPLDEAAKVASASNPAVAPVVGEPIHVNEADQTPKEVAAKAKAKAAPAPKKAAKK